MYNNIGKKIKGLAIGVFIALAAVGVFAGIGVMASSKRMALVGFLIMAVVPVVAWISSWVLYGFGEIIDKVSDIERNTRKDVMKPNAQPQFNPNAERIAQLENLRAQGIISEEEFRISVSRL